MDPDKNKLWFELGGEVGLEVVQDEEVEEEEEDMEEVQIFNDAKAKHHKIMTGMYIMYNVTHVIHVGEVGDTLYECNVLNSMHVREVGDTSMYL